MLASTYRLFADLRDNGMDRIGEGLFLRISLSFFLYIWCTKVPFIFRSLVADSPKSLSHHLLDKDIACLLKRSYSASKKEEVMDDESVLESFFESAKHGKQALERITQDEWENM